MKRFISTAYQYMWNPRTGKEERWDYSKRKYLTPWNSTKNIVSIPCTPENMKLTQYTFENPKDCINPYTFLTKRDNLLLFWYEE